MTQPAWSSDTRGNIQDRVRLVLNGEEVKIAESYEVHVGFLTVPSTFALRLGHSAVVTDLLKRFPPNTPFQLYIGDALQMTGRTDTIAIHEGDGGSIVTIEGRDALAALHDAYVEHERNYTDATYFDFVARNLDELGVEYTLFPDNAANRKLQTGVAALKPPKEPAAKTEIASDEGTKGTVVRIIRSKLGERRYEFVKRHLDHGGLFLRCSGDGNFILSEPNGDQKPVARILRRRDLPRNAVSVKLGEFRNSSAPPRYTSCTIFARAGGRKYKRSIVTNKTKRSTGGLHPTIVSTIGTDIDEEMWNDPPDGFGIKNRFKVIRDANVHNKAQAEAMGRRILAEGRRACWRLQYIATGHTTPSLISGGRCVWTPDTIVDVQDDELGLHEAMWVESVTFRRAPQTETVINLMRKRDLLFGSSEED